MKKILLFILLLLPLTVSAVELPNLYSNKVIIYDLTDNIVIQSKNADTKSDIASLTKIMTTITAIEKATDLQQEVEITNQMLNLVRWDASIAGLKVGNRVTIEDLLYASILPSGADATIALGITLSGSVDNFVNDMNDLAKSIGLENSHFVNVTGLDAEGHYSTPNDVLKLLLYALNNPTFKKIYMTKEYTLSNGLRVKSTINKYNEMMKLDTNRILGSKTGYTSGAGLCISALIKSHNHEFIILTLGAEYIYGNFYNLKDALKLIDFVDINYNNQILYSKDKIIKSIPIKLSNKNKYDIYPNRDIEKFLPNDYDTSLISYKYTGKESLDFRNKKNSKLGKIEYYYDNVLIGAEDIYLNQEIKPDYIKIIKEYYYVLIVGVIGIIIVSLLFRKATK